MARDRESIVPASVEFSEGGVASPQRRLLLSADALAQAFVSLLRDPNQVANMFSAAQGWPSDMAGFPMPPPTVDAASITIGPVSPPPPPGRAPSRRVSGRKIVIYAAIAVGSIALLAALSTGTWAWRRRRTPAYSRDAGWGWGPGWNISAYVPVPLTRLSPSLTAPFSFRGDSTTRARGESGKSDRSWSNGSDAPLPVAPP